MVEAAAQLEEKRRREESDAALLQAQKDETEERLRLAALATNDAIWDWHLPTGHVIWNRALGSLFGHPHEETSADWWISHIHPDDRPRVDASIHAVIDGGGSSWAEEYRFQRVDGSFADIFDRGSLLRDADGRPLRMIGAMLDLTDSKAAALALRESERQFQTLFESIDEGFCVIEFLDGPEGPLSDYVHIAANPAYLANAGIADVVGQRVREMVPDEADGWVETYREVLLTGKPVRFERELVKTGRFLELSAFRVEPAERRQVAVLFQDVTQRHRAEVALRELNESLERRVAEVVAERLKTEEALYQSQKMETIGNLTGGVAHDFNNLLQVIAGNLHLLSKSVAGNGHAERQVANALAGVNRGAKLSRQLLAFARKQPLDPRVVNPGRLVHGMEDLLRRSLGEEIEIETVISGGLWNTAIDPAQLENAVLNLA
ncbi:MAG: PAS domain S-box protein, partial [Haliea sp.]